MQKKGARNSRKSSVVKKPFNSGEIEEEEDFDENDENP